MPRERPRPRGRIPSEFELPGEDAIMRKEGNRLVIEPAAPTSLLALLETLEPLDDDFRSCVSLKFAGLDDGIECQAMLPYA